jgi:hypothetical protein
LIDSVAGNTITLNAADASGNSSQTSVTVTDTTKYSKQSTADAQAIAQGKCIAAHGTTDGGGTLQATTISVQQSDNGSCPQTGRQAPPPLAGRRVNTIGAAQGCAAQRD